MQVELLHHTPLWVAAHGARTCWDSHDKSDTVDGVCGEKDAALIDRVGNQYRHASIMEHVSYNLRIQGISRACLQEVARHRIASYSVKSSRYTLKELRDNCPLTNTNQAEGSTYRWDEIEKYIVLTGIPIVDEASAEALIKLKDVLESGVSNDKAKFCMPECYRTELTMTINIRSLQNFLALRSDKSALWEIQALAHAIYEALPADHKYLFKAYIKGAV